MLLTLGLYIYFNKSAEEHQNRLAIEEVYHNLATEASKIQETTKIVTRYIEKPDGTKITEKSETENKSTESTKVVEQSSDKSIVKSEAVSNPTQYSVTLLGPVKLGSPYDYEQVGIYFGRRILGPVEGIIGGRPFERSLEFGLRFEW